MTGSPRHSDDGSLSGAPVAHVIGVVDAARDVRGIDALTMRGRRAAFVYELIHATALVLDGAEDGIGSAIADLAVRYDAALRALVVDGPVLPMRLGTSVPSLGRMHSLLNRFDDVLGDELDRMRTTREWHVKVDIRAGGVATSGAAGQSRPPRPRPNAEASSGTAYLLGRRDALRAHAARSDADFAPVAAMDDALCALASGVLGSFNRTGGMRRYLVDRADEAEMESVLRAARAGCGPGTAITVAGPLPAYSFVRLALEDL